MNDRVRQLYDQAQQLSPEEQAELLEVLIASAPEPTAGWDKAWAEECERRWQAHERGETKSFSWEEVKAQFRKQ
jgi:putative addiction module component (TIGR02574 family)